MQHLSFALQSLKQQGKKRLIYTAGDSSLDNKHWLFPGDKYLDPLTAGSFTHEAVNGYQSILSPPRMVKDVTGWLNIGIEQRKLNELAAINAAVEATTLRERCAKLLPHDEFIRDNITEEDYLIVSIGGNDIALDPSPKTVFHMLALLLTPLLVLKAGIAPFSGHFVDLFNHGVASYINRLIEKAKPKAVLVCMIYYPCEKGEGWPDQLLRYLGYHRNPRHLQTLIDMMYERATTNIQLEGTQVYPIALSKVLNAADENDYDNRVEPSVQGGCKMAEHFLDIIEALEREDKNEKEVGSERKMPAEL